MLRRMLERRPRRILLAIDGSPGADAALDAVCAMRFVPGDRVYTVTVGEGPGVEVAAHAADRLRCCGVAADVRTATGPVADAVVETAHRVAADLIVVGSRGRGVVLGTVLGSTGRALARTSPIPVLIARARRVAPRRILLAVDGSPDSQAAANALEAVPLAGDSDVVLLHVVPDTRKDAARSRALLSLVGSRLPPTLSTHIEIGRGDVGEAILERAEAFGSDLIAMGAGSTPRAPLRGTTTDKVLGAAGCMVLIARAAERVPAAMRAGATELVAAG